MRSGEISSDPSRSRRLRRTPISCRRNAPTPMRNATHTTSGGTRTLKSLITRAPPFGPRLSASFQLGTRGFRFLVSDRGGVVLHLKPKPDQLAFWPIAAPPHRRTGAPADPESSQTATSRGSPGGPPGRACFVLAGQASSGDRLPRRPAARGASASCTQLHALRGDIHNLPRRRSDEESPPPSLHADTSSRSLARPGPDAVWCRPTRGRRGWRYLAPNQAPTRLRAAAAIWPRTYSRSRPGAPAISR